MPTPTPVIHRYTARPPTDSGRSSRGQPEFFYGEPEGGISKALKKAHMFDGVVKLYQEFAHRLNAKHEKKAEKGIFPVEVADIIKSNLEFTEVHDPITNKKDPSCLLLVASAADSVPEAFLSTNSTWNKGKKEWYISKFFKTKVSHLRATILLDQFLRDDVGNSDVYLICSGTTAAEKLRRVYQSRKFVEVRERGTPNTPNDTFLHCMHLHARNFEAEVRAAGGLEQFMKSEKEILEKEGDIFMLRKGLAKRAPRSESRGPAPKVARTHCHTCGLRLLSI